MNLISQKSYFLLKNLEHEQLILTNLSITLIHYHLEASIVKNLLSKCSGSLTNLKLVVNDKCDYSNLASLLEQTMKITSLELQSQEVCGLALFLKKCPQVQNLILNGFEEEVNKFFLKNLRKLEIRLRRFRYRKISKLPVIPKLDSLWIDGRWIQIAKVPKLFPSNAKVF